MARTRRRPSYRKSKRWNPPGSRRAKRSQNRRGIRASARGFRKLKRSGRTRVTSRTFRKLRRHAHNPGGIYHRSLRDGSKVTVTDDGSVTVHDEGGREYDQYRIKPYEVSRFLKDLGHRRSANKGMYRYDDMHGEYQTLSRNPRKSRTIRNRARRAGTSLKFARSVDAYKRAVRKKYGSSKADVPSEERASWVYYGRLNPRRGRGRGRGRTRRNCGGSRRNPAQFPMPFVSAMNPGRRRGKRRGRRNPPIRRKDARAMKRVLRTHHYRCR